MPTDYAIKDGRTVFDATTYTGNSTGQSIANSGGMKPDLVWIKSRGAGRNHTLTDSVRGTTNNLNSASTLAEATWSSVTAFNSNGFTLGTDGNENGSGVSFVGWQWQAGQGTTSSNTNGSITSTVSVNASAGFSIVTFSGNSTQITVGHGLGVAPKMIIVKDRTNAGSNWCVYHASTGAGGFLLLNATDAFTSNTTMWNNTTPTSTVFNWAYGTSSTNYVAYCWAEIAGFSKFGSYTGNNSADGPFIYTGFRPKFVLFKAANNISGWMIADSSRSTYNVSAAALFPNSGNAEYTIASDVGVDFLSNGIKIRGQGGETNYYSGGTFIYAAFAENPFKYANAR